MRPRKETPARLVEDGNVVECGVFRTPFRNLNLLEADIFGKDRRIPRIFKDLRLKEWQHFGIISRDFYFGFALVDSKYLGNFFCYFFDRDSGKLVEYDCLAPPGRIKTSRELWNDDCRFRYRGYKVEIENRLDAGFHRTRVEIQGKGKKPGIRAELEVLEDLEKIEPLIVVSPIRPNRPLYTHKVACPVRGEVKVSGEVHTLDESQDIALIDVQKTFYPYHTFWKWATCAGYDKEGRLIALNLCQNFIEDDETYNENCLWVDGKISYLGAARFKYDEGDVLRPWHIETTDGNCKLEMKPKGERCGKVNLGLLMSNFHQPFGTFSGNVVDSDGKSYEINDLFGLVEHHLARF